MSLAEILVWRESSEANTTRETLIRDLIEGLYVNPVRIVAFNMGEGWCRDATTEIARELTELCAEMDNASDYIADFISEHAGPPEESEPEAEPLGAKRP
jgi:hypothetical protein